MDYCLLAANPVSGAMNYLPDDDLLIVNDRCPKDKLTYLLKPQC